jgi:hypothetical protein
MTGILLTLVSRGSTTLSYTAVPVISGTVTERSVLTTTNGIWLGAVPITFSYQWFANAVPVSSGSNSYTVQTSDIGKSFTCKVAATNFYGTIVAESLQTTVVTQGVPTKPVVTYNGLSTTGVTLNWSASESGITGYDVYNNTTKLTPSPITALTYAVTGLTAQSSYPFYVKAINAIGTTSSDVLNVITDANAPTGLTQSSITSTGFTLSWTVTSGVSYTIFNGSTQFGSAQTTGNVAITGLSPQTAYTFYVKATATGSTNAISSSAYNITTAPAVPTGVSATSITTTTFTLNWTGVSGVTYEIIKGSTSIASSIAGTNGNMTYNVTGLTAQTSYNFYVKATTTSNSVVSSATSQPLSMQTLKNTLILTLSGGSTPNNDTWSTSTLFVPNGASTTQATDITLNVTGSYSATGNNANGSGTFLLTVDTAGMVAGSTLTLIIASGVTISGRPGAGKNASGTTNNNASGALRLLGSSACPITLKNYGTIQGGSGGGGSGGSGMGSSYGGDGKPGGSGGTGLLRNSYVTINTQGSIYGGGGGGGGAGTGTATTGSQTGSGSSGAEASNGSGVGGNGGDGYLPSGTVSTPRGSPGAGGSRVNGNSGTGNYPYSGGAGGAGGIAIDSSG